MPRPNTAHPLVYIAHDAIGERVTGLSVSVRVFNPRNGQIWDWSTDAFSASPAQATETMTEINASTLPGYYHAEWPGGPEGVYLVEYIPPAGETADDYPDPVEMVVEPYAVDGSAMTLTSGERSTVQGLILSDATPFPGARVDAAVSSRSSHAAADVWGVGARTLTGIGSAGIASQASVDALPTAATLADAVLDEALGDHATSGTLGAALALLDVAVSSRATAAGVWATVTGNADWTYGASLELLRKARTNRLEVTAAGDGTETLYDDDGQTELLEQTLRDGSGRAITVPTGSPALRGAAS